MSATTMTSKIVDLLLESDNRQESKIRQQLFRKAEKAITRMEAELVSTTARLAEAERLLSNSIESLYNSPVKEAIIGFLSTNP